MSIIFVGGSQRSGTTMLQTILCQDQAANPLIQEAKYLRHLVGAYRFGKIHFDAETSDYFKDQAAYARFNAQLIRGFLRATRALFPGTQHLVLREPHLTMLFPDLAELLPQVKFICVVRDPRDAIASMVQVGEKLKKQGVKGDTMAELFATRNMDRLSRHYLSFYAPVFACKLKGFRQRVVIMRYEDLVREPEKCLDALRKFTGLKLEGFDPRAEPDADRAKLKGQTRYQAAWKTERDGGKLSDAAIGGYKKTLTAKEIAAVNEHCKEFMKRFRYAAG
jgi:hypothetical protein